MKAWDRVKKALGLVASIALPFAVYTLAKPALGEVHALMAAAVPSIAWAAIELAVRRRVDAISLLVLAGIALSLLAFAGGGDARFLQLREQLVAAAIGLVFLGSALLRRPLIYRLARARMKRESPSGAQSLEELRDHPRFKRAMMIMTVAWGVGLVAESAFCGALVFVIEMRRYLLVSPIVACAVAGALTAWSFWYARRRIRELRSGPPPAQ